MHIREVWPFLVPALLFQLVMQVLCIAESVREKSQKPPQRALYILTIALFGLPAIAFHLFRAEKTPPKDNSTAEVERAAHFTVKGVFFLLLVAYHVMGLHMLAENVGTPQYTPLITLLTLSYLVMLLYNMLPEGKTRLTGSILPILQLVLCIPIQYMDRSGDNLFLSIIAGFSAINHAPLPKARIYGIGALGAYLAGSTAKTIYMATMTDMSQIVRYFFVNGLVVLLALVAFYTLKKQIVTSVQLEYALNKVRALTVVEERNRLAAEMHDTVGHTLTAAVLSLEAGKLDQGKEQVRRGLEELRASVRAVRAETQLDFATALEHLLEEIQSDTGLEVHREIESGVGLPPLQAGILLSAVKECATNTIKHGSASRVDILVQAHQGQLRLTFTDNGVGTASIGSGSGLGIMRERMERIGGTLAKESAPGEGFTVSLTIPVARKEEAP